MKFVLEDVGEIDRCREVLSDTVEEENRASGIGEHVGKFGARLLSLGRHQRNADGIKGKFITCRRSAFPCEKVVCIAIPFFRARLRSDNFFVCLFCLSHNSTPMIKLRFFE